jgi:hypothetical protein
MRITTIGKDTRIRVVMTTWTLGSGFEEGKWEKVDSEGWERAAVCSDVESRDTRIDPTPPGRPKDKSNILQFRGKGKEKTNR